MTKRLKTLLVYKKSTYEIYKAKGSDKLKELLDSNSRENIEELIIGDYDNRESLKKVLGILSHLNLENLIDFNNKEDVMYRGELAAHGEIKNYDLILSSGGDGTAIEVAHYIDNISLLAVNSDPRHSEGHYCAADRNNLEIILKQISTGNGNLKEYNRLEAELNGEMLDSPILNEIFIASKEVGHEAKYKLTCNEKVIEGKDFGLLISTAMGSTAWIKSAGGKELPPISKKIEIISRILGNGINLEAPYFIGQDTFIGGNHGERNLTYGALQENEFVKLTSMTRQGKIYLDNNEDQVYEFTLGDQLEISYNKNVESGNDNINYNIELTINGEKIDYQPTSKIFVAHEDPSAMTRYRIEKGEEASRQKNSGFLLVIDPECVDTEKQQPLILEEGSEIEVESLMDNGMLCIDGTHLRYDFNKGSKLKIRNNRYPLQAYR